MYTGAPHQDVGWIFTILIVGRVRLRIRLLCVSYADGKFEDEPALQEFFLRQDRKRSYPTRITIDMIAGSVWGP